MLFATAASLLILKHGPSTRETYRFYLQLKFMCALCEMKVKTEVSFSLYLYLIFALTKLLPRLAQKDTNNKKQ